MSISQLSEKQPQNQEDHEDEEDADGKDDSETSEDSDEDEDESEDESEDEEVIARKLNEQLLEDIRRAREAAAPIAVQRSPKEEAALTTIKTVLAFAASDPLVHTTLSNTAVPGQPGFNVLGMLNKIVEEGRVAPQVAGALSHVLVKLAKSEVLFSPLPSVPSETLKRKRDEVDEASGMPEKRTTI